MNCVNCGTYLADADLEYCTHCGCNVMIQRKVEYLSKYYYNKGLEKATIRDLSGAISCLKQSLTYDKTNIDARNLLGLVYFEMGEVVAALSEWVISKNMKPSRNLASEYINRLQANANKLDAINETIRKYNHALALCREGHEDMAAIQLRKILAQNSKLIKGYHLLALIMMKHHEWNRARRILRKAAKIDKTNTTTLRFLKEIDEQTGVTTKLEHKRKKFFEQKEKEDTLSEASVHVPTYKERSGISLFFTLMMGIAVGAAAFWLFAVPVIKQEIYREANKQIVTYSESLATQGAELSRVQGQAQESGNTAEAAEKQTALEKQRSQSYEGVLNGYIYIQQGDLDSAALAIMNVYVDLLSEDLKAVYETISAKTGVAGLMTDGTTLEPAKSENAYISSYESSYGNEDYY